MIMPTMQMTQIIKPNKVLPLQKKKKKIKIEGERNDGICF